MKLYHRNEPQLSQDNHHLKIQLTMVLMVTTIHLLVLSSLY